MQSLDQMSLFVKVVEEAGFSAAARALGVPKSTVSRQIARLEDRLGVRLLHRTTRRVRPTEAGQIYFERCAAILREIDAAEQAVSELQDRPQGTLRITCPSSGSDTPIAPILSAYMERYPDVNVEVFCSNRYVDLVEEGFDLALRAGALADSSLMARRLAGTRPLWVSSPSYLERRGTPTRLDQLARHDLLHYAHGNQPARVLLDDKRTLGIAPVLRSNDYDIIIAATVAGRGIAAVPGPMIQAHLRAGTLVQLLEDLPLPHAGLYVVYPNPRNLSTKVRAFIDLAIETTADLASTTGDWSR